MTLTSESEFPPHSEAAWRRARNVRRDMERAIGLYSLGDRSGIVLRAIAFGKIAYDAVGLSVPRPLSVPADAWPLVLQEILDTTGAALVPGDCKPAA